MESCQLTRKLLIHCPSIEVRMATAELLTHAVKALLPFEIEQLNSSDSDTEKMETEELQTDLIHQTFSILFRMVSCCDS